MKKILLIIGIFLLVGCQDQKKEIVIAEQYGLAYAPVQIMMAKGYLEDALPDYDISWVKLGNTMAIRESMSAGALDVAFLGIPPFIIGTDNGMTWKLFTGLSRAPLALMGREETSLKDISKEARIALPQPGSIQHILLSMAAERELGDATYFDNQLVTMKHPDGMQVLIAGKEIDYHFTSPPYIFQEAEAGMKSIISGEACFDDEFTFIVGVTSELFKDDKVAYDAVIKALKQAMNYLEDDPEGSLNVLETYYNLDRNLLKTYLFDSGLIFETDIKGIDTFVNFMYRNGYIDAEYTKDALIW